MANADEEYIRGVRCEEILRPAKALEHYLRALSLQPDHGPSHNNIGVIQQQRGEFDAAVAAYQKALEANPKFAVAWYNLGNCFREANRLEQAIDCYRRALALTPTDDETRINLATALKDLRQLDEALAVLDEIAHTSPHAGKAQFNRAMVHLLRGQLGQGWDDYEGRLHVEPNKRALPAPRWDGRKLAGRSIMVLSEQGIGDQVMFASCLPDLVNGAKAGTGFVECDPRLVPVFARSFPQITAIARPTDPAAVPSVGPCDAAEYLGTLPRYLRRRIDEFPQTAAYLRPNPELVAKWRSSFARLGGALKVGISWQGGKDAENRRRRSISLALWEPLFQVPGVQFVNVQYGWAAAEAVQVRHHCGIRLDDGSDCDALHDLDDFASKLAALDLVISVDNSTAHLAAALGRPVWTLLPSAPDWRWMLDRETTPWYPTMRLLRCRSADNWPELLQRAARQLTSAAFSRDFELRAA